MEIERTWKEVKGLSLVFTGITEENHEYPYSG
jgi:hypothetical protein